MDDIQLLCDGRERRRLQELRETGATGLEPATSGVTGRSWCLRAERELAGISGMGRTFRQLPYGD